MFEIYVLPRFGGDLDNVRALAATFGRGANINRVTVLPQFNPGDPIIICGGTMPPGFVELRPEIFIPLDPTIAQVEPDHTGVIGIEGYPYFSTIPLVGPPQGVSVSTAELRSTSNKPIGVAVFDRSTVGNSNPFLFGSPRDSWHWSGADWPSAGFDLELKPLTLPKGKYDVWFDEALSKRTAPVGKVVGSTRRYVIRVDGTTLGWLDVEQIWGGVRQSWYAETSALTNDKITLNIGKVYEFRPDSMGSLAAADADAATQLSSLHLGLPIKTVTLN